MGLEEGEEKEGTLYNQTPVDMLTRNVILTASGGRQWSEHQMLRTKGYCFPIRSITLVARSYALFWAPSDAGVCLRAKNQVCTSILEF
jgi:hypothetical protein